MNDEIEIETWIDKSKWDDGPWQTEPDRIQWRQGPYVGLMLRASPFFGNWCGYVGLPPGHPWHGKDYDELDVDVHGGLTFAEGCMDDDRPLHERVCHVPQPGEADDVWWIGFDCHHAFDLAPGFVAYERSLDLLMGMVNPMIENYRDVEYVREQVEGLITQAKNAR